MSEWLSTVWQFVREVIRAMVPVMSWPKAAVTALGVLAVVGVPAVVVTNKVGVKITSLDGQRMWTDFQIG